MDTSTEQNKALVQRFDEDLWNQRDVSVADEIFAHDCVTHQLKSGAELGGILREPKAVKHLVTEWLAGFPDLRFTVEQIFAEKDLVVTRGVMRGMHTGAWFDTAPTGKQMSIRMIVIHRIMDGKSPKIGCW
jgi:predicted ester cyclase